MASSPSIISFSEAKITTTQKGKVLLNSFSGDIFSGEFVGILGPNGSGKSTLLKTLLGVHPYYSGSITIFRLPPKKAAKTGTIGYMPQIWSIPKTLKITGHSLLTSIQNGTQWGIPWTHSSQKKEISELLEKVGATSYANRCFHQLSGGEQQRIMLVQALLGNPDILLLDEPLTCLDTKSQQSFLELLYQLHQQEKKTILLISHDIYPLETLVDKIFFLEESKAILGTYEEIIHKIPQQDYYCYHSSNQNNSD